MMTRLSLITPDPEEPNPQTVNHQMADVEVSWSES